MNELSYVIPKKFKEYEELEPIDKAKTSSNTVVFDKLYPSDKKRKKSNNFLFNKLTLDF